jgi:hypothetical protein
MAGGILSRAARTATAATTPSSNTRIWIVEIIRFPADDDGEMRTDVNLRVAPG